MFTLVNQSFDAKTSHDLFLAVHSFMLQYSIYTQIIAETCLDYEIVLADFVCVCVCVKNGLRQQNH